MSVTDLVMLIILCVGVIFFMGAILYDIKMMRKGKRKP